ncbi:MAG TPA: endonuclease MutS2 [Paludibacteraceae bacterium]|nr:endonuclease MutS2 [Paludibacteraceae bacterium]
MLYPQNIEQKIGFETVRQFLTANCLSDLAKEEIAAISFSSDFEVIVHQLSLQDEMVRLLEEKEEVLPIGSVADLRQAFARTRVEGTFLEVSEVVAVRHNINMVQQVGAFLRHRDAERFPLLHRFADDVMTFPEVLHEINKIVDKFGEVKDSASPELHRIRREMMKAQGSVSRILQGILRQAQTDGIVEQDAAPTMRDGRLVIPIIAMNKRKISGIVHDESATGKTIYVEPTAVVEVNNRLRELENEEKREIVRILTVFTNFLRSYYADLSASTLFLAKIDALRAKARFALQINAIKPDFKNEQVIAWQGARHPLLQFTLQSQGKTIVPLTVKLTEKQRILLISGPNAGGKSVCLKTVGLLQYMLQCGLLIPVEESSEAGIFDSIFIDIGDEQSIENDLSTYSSHLLNMKQFLRYGNSKSLLLIDEFGTGTEPQIGGAIAEAVLEKLNKNGVFAVITTHYTNLKHFASNTEGIVNGAMLYDRHRLQPLFSLQIGRPGSSFAVEMSRKIGLPEDVIAAATEKIGAEHIDYDKNLQDAVRDKRYWEQKRQQIREKNKKLEALVADYELKTAEIKQKEKEIIRQAKQEAFDLLVAANAKIENAIRSIKEVKAEKESTKAVRQDLEAFKRTVSPKEQLPQKTTVRQKQTLSVGDSVRIKNQTAIGEIVDIQDKNIIVAFGQIKSKVNRSQIEKVNRSEVRRNYRTTELGKIADENLSQRKLKFHPEIDMRGMRADEALQAVIYFMDDARMLGVHHVRILHGTGGGVLRQLVRDYLKTLSFVASFRDEHVQLGGSGITVVELE